MTSMPLEICLRVSTAESYSSQQGSTEVALPSNKRKPQEKPEEDAQEEPTKKKQKAAKTSQGEGGKDKKNPSKKSEYELEPDADEIEQNVNEENKAEEEDIVKGLCTHAKFVLEKPLSSYPLGKEGKKELIKNARDALRDQMAFEGKNKAVSLHSTAFFVGR